MIFRHFWGLSRGEVPAVQDLWQPLPNTHRGLPFLQGAMFSLRIIRVVITIHTTWNCPVCLMLSSCAGFNFLGSPLLSVATAWATLSSFVTIIINNLKLMEVWFNEEVSDVYRLLAGHWRCWGGGRVLNIEDYFRFHNHYFFWHMNNAII